MGQRSRPRDLYDIVNLFRSGDFLPHWELIGSVYREKCLSKDLEIYDFGSLENSPFRAELESEWSNMLAHQLPALPPFQEFWNQLPRLFDWLTKGAQPADLMPVVASASEEDGWFPPSTAWVWGHGVPFESVRFAAANHLCVELGYGGSVRVIEPYSLRRTRDGNLLLYGVRVDNSETRAYRVDRIASINVTAVPFTPRYRVEMTTSQPLVALPVAARPGRRSFTGYGGRRPRARTGGSAGKTRRSVPRVRTVRRIPRRRPRRR